MTVAPLENPLLTTTQRVVLQNISWQTYLTLLAESGDRRASKFAYSRGVLEIIMPSDLHENINCVLKRIVTALTEELDLKVKGFGSTTLNRSDLQQGAEPDSCFYIQNVDSILGKRLDISNDPPPDLVIEVDLTSPSSNRLPIYQQLGIPEIWRYRGGNVEISQLQNREYILCEYSLAFPIMPATFLNHLVQMTETQDDNAIVRYLRQWVRRT
jgi:Uma2 family endonuclease